MQQKGIHVSDQPNNEKILRILKYIGITLLVRLFLSGPCRSIVNSLSFRVFYRLGLQDFFPWLVSTLVSTIVLCSIKGLLYRKFVFKSKNSALTAILVLSLLQLAASMLTLMFSLLLDSSGMSNSGAGMLIELLSTLLSVAAFILGYILQSSRLYLEADNTAVVRSKHIDNTDDSDPDILGVELDDIEKRTTPRREKKRGFLDRFDVENDGERVIAQSSRDAIRVMEHKELGIKHEWNCDARNNSQQTQHTSRHVIAPGSGNAVHVAEHSQLDMQHEWNCDDKNARPGQTAPARRVIAPGNYSSIQANEHSALDMKHEWNCNDQ